MHIALINGHVNKVFIFFGSHGEAFLLNKALFSCPQQILRVLENGFMAWLTNFSAYWSGSN